MKPSSAVLQSRRRRFLSNTLMINHHLQYNDMTTVVNMPIVLYLVKYDLWSQSWHVVLYCKHKWKYKKNRMYLINTATNIKEKQIQLGQTQCISPLSPKCYSFLRPTPAWVFVNETVIITSNLIFCPVLYFVFSSDGYKYFNVWGEPSDILPKYKFQW